ncbi:hypothetical protein [Psychrobacter aestuarii]|uniref:Uncharacterized protein n=1 Tax=Psychrobacter aestuarii TaxID=556327 RepID=A0ABN0VU97_9GAMM|nr:hypothetical protein [Psychrobacter aestuarii]
MKNMLCRLPDINEFPEKLYMHFIGKISIPAVVLIASWSLAFAHYLLEISQFWTVFILSFFLMYTVIPTTWYMYKTYRFFIGSFIGTLCTSLLFYYIGGVFLIETGFKISLKILAIVLIVFYFSLFFLDIYISYKNINIYKEIIKNSIKIDSNGSFVFMIDFWIKGLKKSSFNSGLGLSMIVMLCLSVPIIIAGLFGGHPQVSAKIMLNNNQNSLVSFVISLSMIALSMMFLSLSVKEFLKLNALVSFKI